CPAPRRRAARPGRRSRPGPPGRGRDTRCRAPAHPASRWPGRRPRRRTGVQWCRSRRATVCVPASDGRDGPCRCEVAAPTSGPGGAVSLASVTDLLERTAALVAIPSESHDEAPLADLVEHRLCAVGHLTVDRVGANVGARTELGGSQRLAVAGHLDTVPANGNATPRIEGDVLWGLGSADMKGGLAVMLELATGVPEPAVDVSW